MVDTAGTKLKRARKLRKLSLEDAARATKIRVSQLADLEADEYSNFANLAYAKSFLIGYARYLHIDTRPYLDAFADAGTFGLDDYQYLSETPVGIYRAPQRRQVRPSKPKRNHLVLAAAVFGLLALVGVFRFAAVCYERLGGDLDKLAARQEARERAATETVTQPPAAVAPAQAPTVTAPTADPMFVPVDNPTPAPSVAPMDETERAAAAALASTDWVSAPMSGPILAKHPVAALAADHLAEAVHRDGSEPQKVVNNRPRE